MNEDYKAPAEMADREEWIELLGDTPSTETLKSVGLSYYNWQQIAAGEHPAIPLACYRIAQFRRHGKIESILGKGWADFEIRGNRLAFPGLRQPLDAHDLRTTWIKLQEISRLQAENELLKSDIEKLEKQLEKSEKLTSQYRSMLTLEARTGLMLCRINE